MENPNLLEVKNLVIHYDTFDGLVRALNGINFNVKRGETLGLVGETGAGKTTTALGIMGLVPDPPGKIMGGEIIFEGKNLLKLPSHEMGEIRGNQISMVFQDPMTSLNPIMTVGAQIAEVIEIHENVPKAEAQKKTIDLLELVGIPEERMHEYPHQFSGGMKQRVVIAIALACNPKLLIADEPTTALDVTIQAQVLELMQQIKEERDMSVILITHDLGVVADACDRVAIMYAGKIVETAPLEELFENPKHPYTIGLFGSIPRLDEDVDRLNPIKGLMPDPTDLPTGCAFHPRCSYAEEICKKQEPCITNINADHKIRCLIYEGLVNSREDSHNGK